MLGGVNLDHNPDRLCIWPSYFDIKSSRRAGRRVPKDSSVLKPNLEGLFLASREVGLRKIKREERVAHPSRPFAKEGRLWVSKKGAKESIGASSKEEIMQLIGATWKDMQRKQRAAEQDTYRSKGSKQKKSNKSNSSQSSGFKKKSSGFKKRSSFKKR